MKPCPASHKVPAVVLDFVDPLRTAWHRLPPLHADRPARVLMVVRFCFRCYWLGLRPKCAHNNLRKAAGEPGQEARSRGRTFMRVLVDRDASAIASEAFARSWNFIE